MYYVSTDKHKRVEDFYLVDKPDVVEVETPSVVRTKGCASDAKSRLMSIKEKVVILSSKPNRQCKKCGELGHHDSRNCGR